MRSPVLVAITIVGLGIVLSGCGAKKVRRAAKPPRIGSTQTGIASWYGHPYHGRRAANGEVYDMEKMTAAHRTYPFGTWVRVRNLTNDKTVDLRIQDRGPFVGRRIIDLSKAGAREIDMIGPGVAKVKLTVIAAPAVTPLARQRELFAVQVGAFEAQSRADAVSLSMKERFGVARIVVRQGTPPVWRVLVGEEETIENAEGLAERIRQSGSAAFVVRLDESN